MAKEISVRLVEILSFPPQMGRWNPDVPGELFVKRRELQDAATKTYGWSADETTLKPGDEFTLSFIGVPTQPLPACLMSDAANDLTLKVSSLAPTHYVNKAGNLSMDVRTGKPRVFWSCSKCIIPLEGYWSTPGQVVRDLQRHLPFWVYTFPSKRPTKTKKQEDGSFQVVPTTARRVISFGGDKSVVAEDGTDLFVHNTGVVSVDEGEYVVGQNATYKSLGIMVSLYALYDQRMWDPRDHTMTVRRVYQNTVVRLCTRDNLIANTFQLTDPQQWAALAPRFVQVLKGLIFVKDPYVKQQALIDNVQAFAEANPLDNGDNPDAQAAIDRGNGVQRGTAVTIDRLVLDLPAMIIQLGTPIPLSDALQITGGFASAKGNDANASKLTQNLTSRPFKQDVLCLSTFCRDIPPTSLKSYTVYLVTPNKKWNAGSGKSASQLVAEYQANDDPTERDVEDRTFETAHCAFYAIHNRNAPSPRPRAKPKHRASVRDSDGPLDLAKRSESVSEQARAAKKNAKRQASE